MKTRNDEKMPTLSEFMWDEKRMNRQHNEMTVWQFYTVAQRTLVAKSIATEQQRRDRQDHTVYNRVFSRLVQCVETPQDYGMSAEAMRKICGSLPLVETPVVH